MRASSAVLDVIAYHADLSPQSQALIEPDGGGLTYSQLWGWIEAASDRLIEAGIAPGTRVAVLLPQGVLPILAVAGAMNRHIAIPLQTKTTVSEVEFSLRRLSASALIVSPEFEPVSKAATELGLPLLIARNGESPKGWEIQAPALPNKVRSEDSDARLILITSATTGNSKAVPLTSLNVDAGARSTFESAQLVPSDRLLLMVPLCHRLGLESAFAQFLAGGAIITTGGFDPSEYVRWLDDLRPTWYACAPVVHQAALTQLREKRPRDPIPLRFLHSGGAPLPIDVREGLEEVLCVPVLNGYGATEAHYIAVENLPFHGHVSDAVGTSCGQEIGIINDDRALMPCGREGEIVVRGDAVFHGYLDDPEANRAAFQDGWFRTGDLGRLDQEGNLYVTGRLKEMINRGGEKIAPAEVDAVLELHPAVFEAASFAIPHPTLGEDVACAVVLRASSEAPMSAVKLRRFTAERLASFKVPRRIFFVDEIPRGELGKPQRWVLKERLSNKKVAPLSPAEVTAGKLAEHHDDIFVRLHEIWTRIIGRDDLGLEEDFFEAGGDSLAAINMLAEVDQRFGSQTVESAASFLDEPTLEHLACLVGNPEPLRPKASASSEFQIFPVRETGTGKRLFCVPPDGQEGLIFRRLATHLYGQMDLSIVRPASSFYSFALFSLEGDGEAVATLIRKVQPEGPYYVCGFCYGGVVAFEAVRQLALKKQDARLILFDVPMPGCPSLLSRCRRKIGKLWHNWRILRNHNRSEVRSKALPIAAGHTKISDVARLMAWRSMVPMRWLAIPFERVPVVQRFFHWAQVNYFPFYKARPLYAPILQFLSTDEHAGFEGVARFDWRRVARCGIDERFLPLDHPNLFHESNLPKIVDNLREWCGRF